MEETKRLNDFQKSIAGDFAEKYSLAGLDMLKKLTLAEWQEILDEAVKQANDSLDGE